jgi:hypothetical protein
MNVLLLLLIMLVGFSVAVAFRRGGGSGSPPGRRGRVTEPSCGACGYCVRGLESLVCPECGGDLREVGILTPGTAKPLSRKMRVFVWTLFAPLPAFLLAQILSQWITPWVATTQLQRVIFVQGEKLNIVLRAEQQAQQTLLGRRQPGGRMTVPMQRMALRLEGPTATAANRLKPLSVDLATGASSFNDAAGKLISRPGPFDPVAIEQWLIANGHTDPSVAPLCRDVFTAIQEIGTPAGGNFSKFAANPRRGGISEITAHPAFGGFTTYTPTRFGQAIPWAIGLLVWLIGAAIVLLTGRRPFSPPSSASRVQFAGDADQA